MIRKIRSFVPVLTVLSVMLCAGCATVGFDFADTSVKKIQIGVTTKNNVLQMFGSPWRTGIEDGRETWTYGRYTYRLIGESSTKDLVVRFDAKGVVASYTYNTTDYQE